MVIYKYKNIYYFSLKDCKKAFNEIKIPSLDIIPENILLKLGVVKLNISDNDMEKIIKIQKNNIRHQISLLKAKYEERLAPYYPIEQLDLDSLVQYLEYLTNYTEKDNWWELYPLELEDWIINDDGFYYQ